MAHPRSHRRRRTLVLHLMDWQLALALAVFTIACSIALWDLVFSPLLGDDDE